MYLIHEWHSRNEMKCYFESLDSWLRVTCNPSCGDDVNLLGTERTTSVPDTKSTKVANSTEKAEVALPTRLRLRLASLKPNKVTRLNVKP